MRFRLFPPGCPIPKRLFDLFFSFLGLIVASPIMAVVAVFVRIYLGKPVLFRQDRPGYKGEIFTVYKFRTMKEAYDANGHPLPDKYRMTPFGHFLRSTSLDELPEFFNILMGQMSFIGPRPLLIRYLPRYSLEQARRHNVLPGMTGWAQVNGRNAAGWPKRFKLDVYYVDNWSFGLDIKILWMTFWKVLRRENISQPGSVTMTEFMGEQEE